MQCKGCGSDLVRGFTFCLNCGMPVPSEMLTESGLPPRNIDSGVREELPAVSDAAETVPDPQEQGDLQPHYIGEERDAGDELKPQLQGGDATVNGKDLKPQFIGSTDNETGKDLKPKYIGGEDHMTEGGEKVRAVMQESSSSVNDGGVEKLVFCPNCGMRMQHDPTKCEACGMPLGNKPNIPTTQSGIPLFNTDSDPFGSGLGGFGGAGGLSDEDASRIDNFISGNSDPMFYNGDSTFNVRATPNDFAELTQQLADFSSAVGMQSIEVTENTTIRQREPEKGKEREVDDFSMTGDLSSEPVPMSDAGIPIIGDCSMDEDPNSHINLDPYAFINTSMDEIGDISSSGGMPDAKPPAREEPKSVPAVSQPEPLRPAAFSENSVQEVEETPFISEQPLPALEPEAKVPAPETKAHAPEPETKSPEFKPETKTPAPESKPQTAPQTASVAKTAASAAGIPAVAVPTAAVPTAASAATAPAAATPAAATPAAAAPTAPAQASQTATIQRPKPAENTKRCYACGRVMPASDKFCPNCGRSTFGVPNPNIASQAPAPAPQKKKNTGLIVLLVILVAVAASVVTFIAVKGFGAEIPVDTKITLTLDEQPSEELLEPFCAEPYPPN